MFEKVSEEYSNDWRINKKADLNFAELAELRAVIYKAHNDGAAFGYKKAKEQAKELLAKWVELFKPKVGNIPPTPIQVDTEQFLKDREVEK